MIRECFRTDTGIIFNTQGLRDLGLDPSTLYPFVTPRPPPIPVGEATIKELPRGRPSRIHRYFSHLKKKTPLISGPDIDPAPVNLTETGKAARVGTEEEEDLKDALSPIYDRLKLQRAWWILEILPLKLRYQRGDNHWVSYFGCVSCNVELGGCFPDTHH